MARYTVTYLSNRMSNRPAPGDPFVGYDELDGRVSEATNAEYLGERMSVEEEDLFSKLAPGEARTTADGAYFFREW